MNLFTLFASPSIVTGVELTWQASGGWVATLCQLQRTGATVTIVQQRAALTDLPALVQALGPDPGPVALVLAGRGLLFRTVPTTNPGQLTLEPAQFAALLPGSNPADFYGQCAGGPELTPVTLVRKQLVDELLAAFQAAGLWVVDVSLGPLRLEGLLPYLPAAAKQSPLVAGAFLVTLNPAGDCLQTVTPQPVEAAECTRYPVGEDSLTSQQVLPYAAALQVLTAPGPTTPHALAIPLVQVLRNEWRQRRVFQVLRLGIPVGILALLLVNLLLGQNLQAQQDQLAATIGGNQQLLNRVRAVQLAAKRQQEFLTATGWTQPSCNSLCADRLAASLPPGIQLLTVDISPLQLGSGEPGHRLHFRTDVVLIKGQCPNAQQLNAWLQHLTKLAWVRAVRDQNFAYDYAGGTGTFTFTLLVAPAALEA